MELELAFQRLLPQPGWSPELDMLGRAVAENPDCDTTRLAYADALAEAGHEFAESLQRAEVAMRVCLRQMVAQLAVPAHLYT